MQAQWPFTYKKMILLLDLAPVVLPDPSKRLRFLAMLCLQWQLIGRVNNTQKVQVHNFSFSNDQPQTIRCRLTWSKNISEERKAPQQMLIGSMESKICVLQALASYLEQQFEATASTRESFIFGTGNDSNQFARAALTKIFALDAFASSDKGSLDTHSISKGAATYALQNGVVKDHVNL